jgi:hypothetical protein
MPYPDYAPRVVVADDPPVAMQVGPAETRKPFGVILEA